MRALLDDVFEDMTDADWEHSLGGVHAILREDGELIGHASVVQRELFHGDVPCTTATSRPSPSVPTGASAATAGR